MFSGSALPQALHLLRGKRDELGMKRQRYTEVRLGMPAAQSACHLLARRLWGGARLGVPARAARPSEPQAGAGGAPSLSAWSASPRRVGASCAARVEGEGEERCRRLCEGRRGGRARQAQGLHADLAPPVCAGCVSLRVPRI